ncbi:MAG: InlB B-repeat-containing protein, partial [Acholeplasmataceae bacterium]|nr:InlB B-repeat-containing protein [Acholeplasmataceae bacterium]
MRKPISIFVSILFAFVLVACGSRNVKINFNTNGGSQIRAVTVKQLKEIEEPTTTRTGYTFIGWYEDANFKKEFNFEAGATRNITLYAQWEINQYTLSFQTNNDQVLEP